MSSKNSILQAIRRHAVPAAELPNLDQAWIRYDDPFAQFQLLVESVGGRVVRLPTVAELPPALAQLNEFAAAKEIVSTVPSVAGNIDLNAIDDPHQLESIDFAVLPGQFAVAENGAIWVTDEQLKHRAIYFIVQHLALVLPANQIVHNMHEAYARLQIDTSSLGVFISGPSKTADIEQSLVIGAHGPRSLTVFCVDSIDAFDKRG
jgi:L-lactate dehydrogenase complex protein LldG